MLCVSPCAVQFIQTKWGQHCLIHLSQSLTSIVDQVWGYRGKYRQQRGLIALPNQRNKHHSKPNNPSDIYIYYMIIV